MSDAQTVLNHRCKNHPSRDGVGICMSCRKVICEECSTKLDGINTCINCLQEKVDKTRKRPNRFLGALNWIIGLSATAFALFIVVAMFMGLGVWIPDSDGFGFGNQLYKNTHIVNECSRALHNYRRDVGEYPSERHGFLALDWHSYIRDETPPQNYPNRKNYWEDIYDHTATLSAGIPLDAYGTPLQYYRLKSHKAAVIVSAGPDRIFSTTRQTLLEDLSKEEGKADVLLVAKGDDMIEIVD